MAMTSQPGSQPGDDDALPVDVSPVDVTPVETNAMLDRAARELRNHADGGWIDLSDRLISVLRATTRRSWPLRAQFPPSSSHPALHPQPDGDSAFDSVRDSGLDPDRELDLLYVSDQVVISGIRIALRAVEGCAPARISLRLDGHECFGAEIDLVAIYGSDLQAAAEQCRALTVATLDELLGPGRSAAHEVIVDIAISDVTPEHPRS